MPPAALGLAPDPGFPIWLTADPVNYLPLRTEQTSGICWVASDAPAAGHVRDWLILADDAYEGGIHLIDITGGSSVLRLTFHPTLLTPPPPEITGFPIDLEEGYDWEAICLHPWSRTVFLAHEGHEEEIAIYHGQATPGSRRAARGASGRAGPVYVLPGHLCNLHAVNLPGWDQAFGWAFRENLGIEGLACSEDRLFVGLESPGEFSERLSNELSTVLAIWKIDPENPGDEEACELLAIHDTADWAPSLGYTVETICGLDAIDSNHVVGIDRDNCRLFAVEFSDDGAFVRGTVFFLDAPGPAPLESDECPPLEGLPRLFKPTLEGVAAVPSSLDGEWESSSYRVYLTVDPWAPGWALCESEWRCPLYERRLGNLLPALYRYTVPVSYMFPE